MFGLLGIKPGMHVADVGAGSGYYTMLLARAVGPHGEVFAQDITPDYLTALQKRVAKLANVKVGLGQEHDPRLPARALDAAVLIHMYHKIAQPYALLFNLAAAMKPDSLVGIVDLDRPTDEHGTPPDLLRRGGRLPGGRLPHAPGWRRIPRDLQTADAGAIAFRERALPVDKVKTRFSDADARRNCNAVNDSQSRDGDAPSHRQKQRRPIPRAPLS